MIEFSNDAEYLAWASANPHGFVLNLRRHPDPDYVVLHRANCPTVTDQRRPPGAYTERAYRKIGALSVDDLKEAAHREGRRDGSFSTACSICRPNAR